MTLHKTSNCLFNTCCPILIRPTIWHSTCLSAHSDKSRDYTIPAGVIQGVPQPPGVPATSSGWQGNPQAAGAFAPPGVVAQSHGTNGQVPNWSQGNSVHPPVPGAYPGQMFSSTVQYPASGGVPTPAAPQQMPPPHHGNQQLRPAGGAPGTGQPPPPPQYYR
jgi:polypyrimidine tract-binding protein 2